MISLEQIFYKIRFKNVFQYAILHFFLLNFKIQKYYCFVKFPQDWYGSGSYHESSRRSLAHDDWAFGTYFYFFNENHSKSAKMLFRNRFSCKLCHSCRLFDCK